MTARAASATRPTVAVIGAGVSGLTAAYALRQTHEVTLLEADDRLGGHADTHEVHTADGRVVPIDTGFIVHNPRTYPVLLRLFDELDVPTQDTEMSMSIRCDGCGLAYAGGRGVPGVLAQPRRALDPRFLSLLRQVPRFHAEARRLLETTTPDGGPSLAAFLRQHRFSDYFVRHFAIPLVACVWSAGDMDAEAYPARHLFTFLDHHGMLSVRNSPTWRTVVGGSRTYVAALAQHVPTVRTGARVSTVSRHADGVDVGLASGHRATYDQVVLATHADQAAELLVDASPLEKEALLAITYSVNPTVLHTDAAVLPPARARASWNYRMSGCATPAPAVQVSYWMNRLLRLEPSLEDYVVTLNPGPALDRSQVVAQMSYAHPVFTEAAVAAASRLVDAGGDRLAFAGAHLGWGFHEDGARSGLHAAHRLGSTW